MASCAGMKSMRIPAIVIAASLWSVCLVTGCGKKNQQAENTQSSTPSAAQPAEANNPPAPPPDQTTPSPQGSASAPPSTAPAPSPTVVIPVGTPLRVRLDEDLGSKISQPGQSFSATVVDPVVGAAQTVIPPRAHAEG